MKIKTKLTLGVGLLFLLIILVSAVGVKVNGGDFILKGYSGGIIIQNTSPVEKIRIILY